MNTATRSGRPRDRELDHRIAQAALDVFGEVGWAGFAIEAVARRAQVGKASVYLRWNSREALLTGAVSLKLAGTVDADTGTLHGDLVYLAKQSLDVYVGRNSRASLRLYIEGDNIPGVGEHVRDLRLSQVLAARAIVRRGIARGELTADTPLDVLLDTVIGGAMMHAMITPPEQLAELASNTDVVARRLVDFLLRPVAVPSVRQAVRPPL